MKSCKEEVMEAGSETRVGREKQGMVELGEGSRKGEIQRVIKT